MMYIKACFIVWGVLTSLGLGDAAGAWSTFEDGGEAQALAALPCDCPEDLDLSAPARTVLQVVQGVFHKWHEYEWAEDGFCLVMEAPESRPLSAAEAARLLRDSNQWLHPSFLLPQAETLDPGDARFAERVALPYLETESDENVEADRDAAAVRTYVIGVDDRTRVSNTGVYPWNVIGSLSGGTGFLVGPHTVLTNGHVVYDKENWGGFRERVEFAPGQYQSSAGAAVQRPFGARTTPWLETNTGYVNNWTSTYSEAMAQFDYATVLLVEPFDELGTYLPLQFEFKPNAIQTAGYPAEAQGESTRAQWYAQGAVKSVGWGVLYHYADATGGQSGSPVMESSTGSLRVVAIHCAGNPEYGLATHLTANNGSMALIEEWMRWKPTVCPSPCTLEAPASSSVRDYSVSWGAAAAQGVAYVLEEAENSGFSSGLRTVYTGGALEARIENRQHGVDYYYRVRSRDALTEPSRAPSEWKVAAQPCKVRDVTPPTLTLIGETYVRIRRGSSYADPGAQAWDDFDGDLTAVIKTNNSVNADMRGEQLIAYQVKDAAGNEARAERTVKVVGRCGCTGGGGKALPHDWNAARELKKHAGDGLLLYGALTLLLSLCPIRR